MIDPNQRTSPSGAPTPSRWWQKARNKVSNANTQGLRALHGAPTMVNLHPLVITPEWAADALERHREAMANNGGTMTNRNINMRTVEKYVTQMRAGVFAPTTTIMLDDRGQLLDGFHRLTACVESGASFGAFVLPGVPPSIVLDTVDTGRRKSLRDVLKMDNWEYPAVLSAALVTIGAWQNHDGAYVQHGGRASTMDYRQLLIQTREHGRLLEAVAGEFQKISGKVNNYGTGRGPAVAVGYYEAVDMMDTQGMSFDESVEFAASLLTPMLSGEQAATDTTPLPPDCPLLYVHRRMQAWATGGGSVGGVNRGKHSGTVPAWAYHQVMIDAVNAYFQGHAWTPSGSTRTTLSRGIPMLRGMLGTPVVLEVAPWL